MKEITFDKLAYLVFLEPVLRIFCFFFNLHIPFNTYIFASIIILFIMTISKRYLVALLLFAIYLLLEIVSYPFEGVRQYMISFGSTIMGLWYFTFHKFKTINWLKVDKAIIRCAFIILLGQIVSILNIGLNLNSILGRGNIYGALIPHEFAYYCLIFSLYFAYRKKLIFSFIFISLCIILGRRTTLFLSLLNIIILLNNSNSKIFRKIFYTLFVLLFLVNGITLFNDIVFGDDFTEYSSINFFEENTVTNKFTRGRNIIWSNGLSEILRRDVFNLSFWFGDGPRSSVDFNARISGVAIWMHNDFIDILFCLGVVAFVTYIFSLLNFSYKKGGLLFLIYAIMMCFFNGFMHYNSISIIYVFTLISYLKLKNKNLNEKKSLYTTTVSSSLSR